MAEPAAWLELTISGGHPALAEATLEAVGALAITLVDGGDELLVEPAPGAGPVWAQTHVQGLFHATADTDSLVQGLQDMLDADVALQSRLIEDRDWIRAWTDHYHPMQFGERLWVCPKGRQVDVADAAVIYMEPGMAFGTGTHPTTALCLHALSKNPPAQRQVIDYGCGSGILAIAALKLGAERALYFDIDPQAMKATLENGAHNLVGDRMAPLDPDDTPLQTADCVLANILAAPLIELAEALTERVRPGGRLILSGLLERQEQAVKQAYEAAFRFDPAARQEGWSCLTAVRL